MERTEQARARRGFGNEQATGDPQPAVGKRTGSRFDLFGGGPMQLKQAVVTGGHDAVAGTAGPLPGALRAQMEHALGADFSAVRVREDASAAALGAEAYARGDELVFAPGRFDPSSQAGKALIGHELVHVLQQRQGRVAGGAAINGDAGLEREADELGARAARGEVVTMAPGGGVARGDTAQLKPGKVQRKGVWVRIDHDEVELSTGTAVDIEGDAVQILSGPHQNKHGRLIKGGDGSFAYEPERDLDKHHEVYTSCSTGFVGLPEAYDADDKMIMVRAVMQTRNLYDRVKLKVGAKTLGGSITGLVGVEDKHIHDQNPAWTNQAPIGHPGYEFAQGFTGFAGEGAPSALRNVFVHIPIDRVRSLFNSQWTDAGICILLGLDMYYGGVGPSTASLTETRQAYATGDARGHQYGFGATSSSPMLGRVTFSDTVLEKLKIGIAERKTPEDYHREPVGQNPPNSLELPFPPEYMKQHPELLPLVPPRFLERDEQDHARLGLDTANTEMQLKLQTRIENEATLKVSSREGLHGIVQMLSQLGEGNDVTALMGHGDPLLAGFTWTLEKKKPMVFTDVYLDDEKLNGLRAGLGIRKRRSKEAAKLNVKTGAGYNVKTPSRMGKPGETYPEDRDGGQDSDIWRRHEIGFSLNPDATAEEIGAFLQSGVGGHDPWNLGAQQSNLGLDQGAQVDFSQLREQMVLIGDRTKFNLKATPRSGQGVINIEISCDHTVGCRPSDWDIDPTQEGFSFTDWYKQRSVEKFPETFNVEMELEHLGAGGSTEAGGSSTESGGSSSKEDTRGTMWGLPSRIKKQKQEELRLGAPQGFPDRRPYTKKDASDPAFGTPSFSIFYAAHNRVIHALQERVALHEGDLGPDVQKLEAIRDKLNLLGDQPEHQEAPLGMPRLLRPSPQPLEPRTPQIIDTPRIDTPRIDAPSTSAPQKLSLYQFGRQYRKGTASGTGLNCLLDSLCQIAPEAQQKFGGAHRGETVQLMRASLNQLKLTRPNKMLDLTHADEGQAILSELDIDVVIFVEKNGDIEPVSLGRSGGQPRYLHFKNAHYSPVFAKL